MVKYDPKGRYWINCACKVDKEDGIVLCVFHSYKLALKDPEQTEKLLTEFIMKLSGTYYVVN